MLRFVYVFLLILGLSACSLNNSDSSLGPLKGGEMGNDPDYYVNLWPEGTGPERKPNPKSEISLKSWPKIDEATAIFLGDESLHYNWGLVLKASLADANQKTSFLSACKASAHDWKQGGRSECGLFSAPFTKFIDKPIYLTHDMQKNSERALPIIFSQPKLEKIVLSFGYYLKDIDDAKELRQELMAIEILAKWAHSTGKTCQFVSPVGPHFLETGNSQVLPSDLLRKLKVITDPYCYWVNAKEVRENFLQATGIDPKTALTEPDKKTTDEIILIDENSSVEKAFTDLGALDLPNAKDINLPDIIDDESKGASDGQKRTNKKNIEKDVDAQTANDDHISKQDSELSAVQKRLQSIKPSQIPRPQKRPDYIDLKKQDEIREKIELKAETQAPLIRQAETQALSFQEPKYLWNGYAKGRSYTRIGKEELARYGKELYQTHRLSDATKYCPNYWNLSLKDKRNVWLFLYSTMALYESSFKAGASGQEITGGTSLGLFQLHYGGCRQSAKNAQDLINPRVNFRCAIRKSAYFVREGNQIASGSYASDCKKQGCQYRGGALDKYWSTLRNPYNAHVVHQGKKIAVKVGKRPEVIAHLRSLPHCKK